LSTTLATDQSVRNAYAADASGLVLVADAVARPQTIEDVQEVVRRCGLDRISLTCAGAQTSTTAASITDRGAVLSLRGLDWISDVDESSRTMRVGAGALVGAIKRAAAATGLLFAPDPTSEEECTIGGAIACNASGARTFKYGATRRHVRALRVVLANGDLIDLRRSDLEKNTVGYAFAHDPIDWFIGSEGTLGVIVEAELSLLPLPKKIIGVAALFPSEATALSFVVAARESPTIAPRCIEYFDTKALEIARNSASTREISDDASAMVYVEEEVKDEMEDALERWAGLIDESGTDMDPLVFEGENQLREARRIRHSIPATMNERGGQHRHAGGRKISTDWAVPYRALSDAITAARALATEAGIDQAVIYGHAGNGHPHQNFIARHSREVHTIEEVIERTLKLVIGMGGTVAAEHGIGKIKRRWLPLQMNQLQISMMTAVKRELDPLGILAPGNIL
jgi:FAD/FMN-containing dehydrogenase